MSRKLTFYYEKNLTYEEYSYLEGGRIPAYALVPILNKLSAWDTIEMCRLWNIELDVEVLGRKRKFNEI